MSSVSRYIIAAHVAALAQPGEVLFTKTVRSLVIGSGITYETAGHHALKGVPGEWALYRLTAANGSAEVRTDG
jgi:class 3 adenylate cyclase